MKIRIFLVALLVLAFNTVSGCTPTQTEEPASASETKSIVLGVSIIDSANLYYANLLNGIQQEALCNGIQVIIKDAQSNPQTQIDDIQSMITEKVDAIIVAAIEQSSLDPVLLKAKNAGIKIIAQSTKVDNCDMFISADEWEMGHMLGEYIGKWIRDNLNGTAEYAILDYPDIPQLKIREKGITDGIHEFALNAALVCTAVGASNPDQAYQAGLLILKNHPNVKVIVGTNDNGAIGAYNAYRDRGKSTKNMLFGGIDATSDAVELIQSKTAYRCTVDTMPEYNGILDVEFALKIINGQTVPELFKMQTKLITQ